MHAGPAVPVLEAELAGVTTRTNVAKIMTRLNPITPSTTRSYINDPRSAFDSPPFPSASCQRSSFPLPTSEND